MKQANYKIPTVSRTG